MATIKSTGKITSMKQFSAPGGPGLDVYIEDTSEGYTIYLQVVLYDEKAKKGSSLLRQGDIITVEGPINLNYYQKADGTKAFNLVVVNPKVQPESFPAKQEMQELQEQKTVQETKVVQELQVEPSPLPDEEEEALY